MAEKLKKNVLIIFGTNWNKRKRGRKIKNTAIKNGAKMMTAVAAYLQSTKTFEGSDSQFGIFTAAENGRYHFTW